MWMWMKLILYLMTLKLIITNNLIFDIFDHEEIVGSLFLSQYNYIQDLSDRFKMDGIKNIVTPLNTIMLLGLNSGSSQCNWSSIMIQN